MAQYEPVSVSLRITLETALHIGTGQGLGPMLDDRIVQGPHPKVPSADVPLIPGSTLKGRLRHYTHQILPMTKWPSSTCNQIEVALFGSTFAPGLLVFNDAHLEPGLVRTIYDKQRNNVDLAPYTILSARSFVSLSRQRRVALDGHLFRIELAERGLSFAADITGNLRDPARPALAVLLAAVCDMTYLGGHKSRGLGACTTTIEHVSLGNQTTEWTTFIQEELCRSE